MKTDKKSWRSQSWLPCLLITASMMASACSKDESTDIAEPTDTGYFIDQRDGSVYHCVTIGQLDWTVENLRYDLGDRDLCIDYQSVIAAESGQYSTEYHERFGMLYTYSAALQAVPEGWRVPTDADWTALEECRGYLSSAFGMLYGGYFTKNTYAPVANGCRFMGSWAYYWTSTKDGSKTGEYYFARKKFYGEQDMVRLSIEPSAYFLSVRLVREHR